MAYNNQNGGKKDMLADYIQVNDRILKFYEKFPNGRITTELIKWENEVIVMKSFVYRDEQDIIAATGMAYEKEGSSFINKTSALENCETSAVGRALAMLGFEIKKSIASYEEVANAKLNQQEKQQATKQPEKKQQDKPQQKETKKAEDLPKFEPISEKTISLISVFDEEVASKTGKVPFQPVQLLVKNPNFTYEDLGSLKESEGEWIVKQLEAWIKKLNG